MDKDALLQLLGDLNNMSMEELEEELHANSAAAMLHLLQCAKDHHTECDFYAQKGSVAKKEWAQKAKEKAESFGLSSKDFCLKLTSAMDVIRRTPQDILPLLVFAANTILERAPQRLAVQEGSSAEVVSPSESSNFLPDD